MYSRKFTVIFHLLVTMLLINCVTSANEDATSHESFTPTEADGSQFVATTPKITSRQSAADGRWVSLASNLNRKVSHCCSGDWRTLDFNQSRCRGCRVLLVWCDKRFHANGMGGNWFYHVMMLHMIQFIKGIGSKRSKSSEGWKVCGEGERKFASINIRLINWFKIERWMWNSIERIEKSFLLMFKLN